MRFRCNLCGTWPTMLEFEDNPPGTCPECGAKGSPLIVQLVDVHFLIPDIKGPIRGNTGANRSGGQRVACEPGRSFLALPGKFYSATGEVRAVTCPKCKGTPAYREVAAMDEQLQMAMQQARESRATIVDLGDKG